VQNIRASVLIPTRRRPEYLEVTLRSIVTQAEHQDAEVIVISDGPDAATRDLADRYRARVAELPRASGLNAVRNEAVNVAQGELLVFVDDDVVASSGWLEAYLRAANEAPHHDVFGGPIRARLEGGGPRACGREKPPITSLDLGQEDRDVQLVWGANMAIRADAFRRLGGFDESIIGTGDEEEWLRRYIAEGKRVRYVAGAAIIHRRNAEDAKLMNLAKTAYGRGRAARRYDKRKHAAPPIGRELVTLTGCVWHVARRRCALGLVFGAHAAGRLRQAIADRRA